MDTKLSGISSSATTIADDEPLSGDIAIVLSNLKQTVRKALLEQILWWGQTSSNEPVITAVNRIKKHIKETSTQLEEA